MPDFVPEEGLPEKTGTARFWELIKEELATILIVNVLFFPLSGGYLLLLGFSLPCFLGNFYIRTVLKQYSGA